MMSRLLLAAIPVVVVAILGIAKILPVAGSPPPPVPTLPGGPPKDTLPPAKRALVEQEEQERAAALREHTPAPKNPGAVSPPEHALATPAPHLGEIALPHTAAGVGQIVEDSPPPFGYTGYAVFTNKWVEEKDGDLIQVYVGAKHDDQTQGVVVVETTSLATHTGQSQIYPAPDHTGAVRVVGANGERLMLSTADGEKLTFDVASRQFVVGRSP